MYLSFFVNPSLTMHNRLQVFSMQLKVNPLRMFQFSYNLVTGGIVDLIPLFIRADLSDGRDTHAARQILQVFTNRLYIARDDYYQSVTQTMRAGCGALSLMVGYNNPWGILLRKQCEAVPHLMQGLLDLLLSLLVNVPFAKCVCVDARGSNFVQYAMDNCYFFAPPVMKPDILALVQRFGMDPNNDEQYQLCGSMVQTTADAFKDSMQPFITAQTEAIDQTAPAMDSLLSTVWDNPTACLDFANNPFTVVLIPDPVDYFGGCGLTSGCRNKCIYELQAFENELERVGDSATTGTPETLQRSVESVFFDSLTADAYTPLSLLMCMVQLEDCTSVCGGADEFTQNTDTCVAVAGINEYSALEVRKYCTPKQQGANARIASHETWIVTNSESFTHTLVDLYFADTVTGDTLLALRDNHAGNTETGYRKEYLVTIHPRSIQCDAQTYDTYYGLPTQRERKLTVFTTGVDTLTPITGLPVGHILTSITSMVVVPVSNTPSNNLKNGCGPLLGNPWVLLSVTVDTGKVENVVGTGKLDLCIQVQGSEMLERYPAVGLNRPVVCDLQGLSALVEEARYLPVILPPSNTLQQSVAVPGAVRFLLVPTLAQHELCVRSYELQTSNPKRVLLEESVRCFNTPPGFFSGSQGGSSWSTAKTFNAMMQGTHKFARDLGVLPSITDEPSSRGYVYTHVLAQNTLDPLLLTLSDYQQVLRMFSTGDQDVSVNWLLQTRLTLNTATDVVVSRFDLHSQLVDMQVDVLLSCDRVSCLGCTTMALQALCYAAQQCAVQQCVGTTVSLDRPLCNIGLLIRNNLQLVMVTFTGLWTMFAESYTTLLTLSFQV
jgi:hypothetical protein